MFFIQSKNISRGATSHQKKTFCENRFRKYFLIVWEILILQFHTTKWSAPLPFQSRNEYMVDKMQRELLYSANKLNSHICIVR